MNKIELLDDCEPMGQLYSIMAFNGSFYKELAKDLREIKSKQNEIINRLNEVAHGR